MAACVHAEFCMWDHGSEVDLLVHTKSRQICACYIAAMFDDRTYKNPKGQVKHCLISARKIVGGDSLSVSVATHDKLWAGKAKWLKNTIMHLSKK